MNLNDLPVQQINLIREIIIFRPGNRLKLDKASLEELAESMRRHGLINPPLLRRGAQEGFECIAGERRIRAAIALSWEEIPCRVVPSTVSDEEVRALQLVENLHRSELTPWEESQQLAELKALQPDCRIEDLADQVGKTPTWVAQRLALGKLDPELRQLVMDQAWPTSHVVALARRPLDAQAKALEQILDCQEDEWEDNWVDEDGKGKAPPLWQLQELLEADDHLLAKAAWKKDDAKLDPVAGACSTCPKRSSAQALLFPEVKASKDDRCLDPSCWDRKEAAFLVLQTAKLEAKKLEPVLLTDFREPSAAMKTALAGKAIQKSHDFKEVKKGDKGARPALLVSGAETGKEVWVKELPKSKAMPARREIDQETGKAKPLSNAARLKSLELTRKVRHVELWAENLQDLRPEMNDIVAVVATFGTPGVSRSRHSYLGWDDVKRFVDKAPTDQAQDLWAVCWPVLEERCRRTGPINAQADDLWAESLRQAKALGFYSYVWVKMWEQAVAEVKFPRVLEKAGLADPHAGGVFPEEKSKKKGKGVA